MQQFFTHLEAQDILLQTKYKLSILFNKGAPSPNCLTADLN